MATKNERQEAKEVEVALRSFPTGSLIDVYVVKRI